MGKRPRACRLKNEVKPESDPNEVKPESDPNEVKPESDSDDDVNMQEWNSEVVERDPDDVNMHEWNSEVEEGDSEVEEGDSEVEEGDLENESSEPKCKKQKVSLFDQAMQKCTLVAHARRAYWGPMDQKLVQKIDVNGACNISYNDTTRDIKKFQIEGINFLWVLRKLGVGGAIIADDTGLGKTLQVIAFLAVLKHVQRNTGPHLVVAPVSLLQHWKQELARWCPLLNVVVYHGSKKEEICDESGEGKRTPFEILITSYSVFEGNNLQFKKDRKFLKGVTWDCVIMDEGHCLKKTTSSRRIELQGLAYSAKQRIMLTSAPIATEIQGLWSLLNLLIPDIFYADVSVQECFGAGRDRSEMEAMTLLLSFLKPFIICRAKCDVLDQLPPRSHHYNLRS